MEGKNPLFIDLVNRLNGIVVIGSDVKDVDVSNIDIEALIGRISAFFDKKQGAAILTKSVMEQIIKEQSEEKTPTPVEIVRSGDFRPLAREVNEKFSVRQSRVDKTGGTTNDFTEYFRDRFNRLRDFISTNRYTLSGMITNIEVIKNYASGREVGLVGMVYDKMITKNGNILVTLEDETGVAKVLFTKSGIGPNPGEIFENAKRILNDDVIAIRGKMYNQLVIVNSILWPDVPIHPRKTTEEDVAIAFLSDAHVGSKLFLDKHFGAMLKWLNGNVDSRKELAGKIKYLIINGDVADGIGVYPGQDRDLAVLDIFKQYSIFFDFVRLIPDYIQVFITPGNHDAVQRAEPQPAFTKDLIGDFSMDNVHIISNPSYINIDGLNVLAYHGTSLDSIIQSIPNCSYSKPEVAMIEVLRRRHLSPVYGGNIIVPSRNDALLIDLVPDILTMGHVHKNGYSEYHGTLIVNSGTWQARTSYQIKQGHIPTPGVLPVYETKSMQLSNIDFNSIVSG